MKMKGASLLALFAAAIFNDFDSSPRGKNQLTPKDIKIGSREKLIPKGCKKFNINGVEIIASNEKNAIRKYQQKNKH